MNVTGAPSAGPLSPRAVRALVQVVCVTGIGGMIFGSIKDNNGIAITFGMVTAVSVLFLILLTSVVGPGAFGRTDAPGEVDDDVADDVERRVRDLVERGADELAVRQLVTRATELRRRPR